MVPEGLYWEIAYCIIPMAEPILMGYYFCRLAKPFVERKKSAFCAGAVYAFVMLLLSFLPRHPDGILVCCTGVLAAFLVLCIMDRKNYEQKAFLSVIFFSMRWLTSGIAEILYDKLYAFAERTYLIKHPNMDLALYVGVCLYYLALQLLFNMVVVWCILKAYAYKHARMAKSELLMLTIPSFAGVIGYLTMQYYRIFYIGETGWTSDAYDILAALYYVVAEVTIVVVIVLYQSIKAKQEERLQKELLATQLDSIRQHTTQVESLYQNIRSIKHDMTNHILTLERLYAGNQIEEARAYGTDLKAALAEATGEIRSGNPVTDVILQEFKSKAEERKIHFQSEFYFPEGTSVNAFDVSVILNNALQNALEHAEESEKPYISVRSYRRNNAYIIEVNNSFTGSLRFDAENGLPVTTKQDTDMVMGKVHGYRKVHGYGQPHGYGLANIRRVARKYSGDIDITVKEGEFRLGILIMIEDIH